MNGSSAGTCAADVLKTEHAFFNATLVLRNQYDVIKALAAAGITPSNTQSFTVQVSSPDVLFTLIYSSWGFHAAIQQGGQRCIRRYSCPLVRLQREHQWLDPVRVKAAEADAVPR
jgi:hypothetical protein